MNKLHYILFILTLLTISNLQAADPIHTRIVDPTVRTLRIRYALDDPNQRQYTAQRPFLILNDEQQLEISFDQLSHSVHYYTYTLIHLNADWTESSLSNVEYADGFSTADIIDYEASMNTQQDYTHYRFLFPNENMQVRLSGNYALKIYENGNTNQPVAYVCFTVVEPKVTIEATIHSHTAIELSGRYQQVDIDLITNALQIQSPSDICLVVQQNGRFDNLVFNPKPSFVETHKLRYLNHRELIFEGGQEYRHFDLSSLYIMGTNVENILFDRRNYHALLYADENLALQPYLSNRDANGQFLINAERTEYDDYEAEYLYVHFTLPQDAPFFDGRLYLNGELTYNHLDNQSLLQYNNTTNRYDLTLYLKQGGYDYQYLFLPKGAKKATSTRTEGSHWQTDNEYTIYVYYRPFGARADQLVGIQQLRP